MNSLNSRRSFIKKGLLASSFFTMSSFNSFEIGNKIIGHGDFRFKLDSKWSSQDAVKHPVDNCHEMVIDSKDRLYMTTTTPKNNILIYSKDGKVLNSLNLNFPGAHGLTLSNEGGEEFLYVTDPDNNKFCKTTIEGKKIFEFSAPKEISAYSSENLFKPTEIAVSPNGDFYVGTFKENKRHGNGIFTSKKGHIIDGQWQNDVVQGLAKATYLDGSIYIGNYLSGKPHGLGKIVYSDGGSYSGSWVNGRIEGAGKAFFADGTFYEGNFKNAKQHGMGKIIYNDGHSFNGQWVDGLKQGQGLEIQADGSTYQGTFIAGRPHGKGKLKLLNGFEYFGDWIDGEISGYGQITYSNGNVYVGNLIQAQPNGLGKMTYISGKIFNGIWDLGKEKKPVE